MRTEASQGVKGQGCGCGDGLEGLGRNGVSGGSIVNIIMAAQGLTRTWLHVSILDQVRATPIPTAALANTSRKSVGTVNHAWHLHERTIPPAQPLLLVG